MSLVKAERQAYKDMEIAVPNVFCDFYFDIYDVSRSRVFTSEARKLNKALTQ